MSRLVHLLLDDYDKNAFAKFTPTPGFSIDNARALIWMSQLAYEAYPGGNPDIIAEVGKLWGFAKPTPFEHRKVSIETTYDTCGLIAERPDAVVLAVAGTDPGGWETVVSDFTFRPGGDTHAGFQDAADSISDEAKAAIKASTDANKPLFVTGHSLGAAIAAIAALDHGANPQALYFFGMPRPGNAQFHSRYAPLAGRTFRLVHGLDVVARVPPSMLLLAGYRHVGQMLSCASGRKFDGTAPLSDVASDDPPFAPELVNAVLAAAGTFLTGHLLSPTGPGPFGPFFRFIPQPIRDHLQDSYWEALTP